MQTILTLGLAALSAANPLAHHYTDKRQAAEEARLVISLDSGDGATTLAVPLGTTVVTNFFNRNSFQTSVNTQGVFCGGFQDSGATILVGTVFDSTNPAIYSTGADATMIGSYWCSRNKMAVEKRAKQVVQPPSGGGNGGGGNNDNNNEGGNGGGGNDGNNGGATVNVQIEQQSDQFVGVDIPLNQLTTQDDIRQLGQTIIVLDIVGAEGVDENVVNCQVFSDREGNQPLGAPATLDEATMVAPRRTQPAPFGSILCADSPLGGGGNGEGNNGGNNGGGGGGGAVQGNVRLQIETNSDEFRGTEVPVNQLVTVDQNRQLVGTAIRIDVVGGDAGGNIDDASIKCQAWADAEGKQPIGRPATVDLAAELSMDRSDPAQFRAITCNA